MKPFPEFVQQHFSAATLILEEGRVNDLVFSRGTYQAEVEGKNQKAEFPFLQIQDDGTVSDSFCSCLEGAGCVHLAAAYLKIFHGQNEPLHIRFHNSFWNRLFQMSSKRQGYEPACLSADGKGGYFCKSKTGKELFAIEPMNEEAKKELKKIVEERVVETEETSLKFSNWPAEELALFRAGQGSHPIQYELSFWSDLAKWVMRLQEEGKAYAISYAGRGLPREVSFRFPDLRARFYIAEVNWPWLIPSLNSVASPLRLFDSGKGILHNVEYDPDLKKLRISHKTEGFQKQEEGKGIAVGDWFFIEGRGFYRKGGSLLFQESEIEEGRIAEVLNSSWKDLVSFLPIRPEPRKASYKLRMDAQGALHIEFYILEPGDLASPRSSLFIPWVYVDGKGFYCVEDWLFEGKEKIVARPAVAEFVNRHRIWLHQFPGFQTHLGSLDSYLIYRWNEKGNLIFDAALNFPEGFEDAIHFDEWVYVPGQGFYMKKQGASRLSLHPGLEVPRKEIPLFIQEHKEELEQVQGFFSTRAFVLKTGLRLTVNAKGRPEVSPQREYAHGIDPDSVQVFYHFFYVPGLGFHEASAAAQLPARFQEPFEVTLEQEAQFVTYDLDQIAPYVVFSDSSLKRPARLWAHVRFAVREKVRGKEKWGVHFSYESEYGEVSSIAIWDALNQKRVYLFSPAGLIALREARFNWLSQISEKCLDREKGVIWLNAPEWLRLCAMEEVKLPAREDPRSAETCRLFEEMKDLETDQALDISQLKSTLRPYQEQGLRWLWFLYCHGLSGLLCDDMGLGKTHQAMALLAAVSEQDTAKKQKYLVVCPTSVIYHWQELLKRFLPDCSVCTYYGLDRSLEYFDECHQLLLTSYGILRTGRDSLRSLSFEVAIFDEIQVAKNYASQTHKALRAIRANMRLGLSGTPIENRVRELKSLMDIVLPSYLPSEAVFRDLFIYPIEKQNDEEKKRLLGKLVKPFILRRKKSEVLTDLPEKIEEISYCDLSQDQKSLYSEVTAQTRDTVYKELRDASKPVSYMHIFAVLMNLKRICDHPALYVNDVQNFRKYHSGKWDLFVELLAEALGSGQKVVVFSQYLDMLSMIESYLKEQGIGYAAITGATRNRSEQLVMFREDPECAVFVASLLAAGVGIDLTVASVVIHYDRWWNPAKENQATDRVHRIGQSRGVQVFKLVTKDSIEEHIHELIEQKMGLMESVLGSEDQIAYLSREELLQVFDRMYTQTT